MNFNSFQCELDKSIEKFEELQMPNTSREKEDSTLKTESEPISIIVEGKEFLLEKSKCIIHFPSVFIDDSKINLKKFSIPSFINKNTFDNFLKIIFNQKIQIDSNQCKSLIILCDHFDSNIVMGTVINDYFLPYLDKYNCLTLISDYDLLINTKKVKNKYFFEDIIETCIEVASRDLLFLINNQELELRNVRQCYVDKIIEFYLSSVSFNNNIDYNNIIRFQIKNKKLNDIFDFLENERKNSINLFEPDIENSTINWKIEIEKDKVNSYYKESDDFIFEKLNMVVLNYYDIDKDSFIVAFKILKANSNDEQVIEDNQIFSILSYVEIPEIGFKSQKLLNCVINCAKTRILICKIENFSRYSRDLNQNVQIKNIELTIKIYLKMSYSFNAIISHICKNFYEYYSLPSITKISRSVFNLILKSKLLNPRIEDEVLYAILLYISKKQYSNTDNIAELFSSLKWNKISLDSLLDLIMNECKILQSNKKLQESIAQEFQRRFDSPSKTPGTINSNSRLNSVSSQEKVLESNQSFPKELVSKLIKIALRFENSKNGSYIVASTNSNTSNINSNSISINNIYNKSNQKQSSRNYSSDTKMRCLNKRINYSEADISKSARIKYKQRFDKNESVLHKSCLSDKRIRVNLSGDLNLDNQKQLITPFQHHDQNFLLQKALSPQLNPSNHSSLRSKPVINSPNDQENTKLSNQVIRSKNQSVQSTLMYNDNQGSDPFFKIQFPKCIYSSSINRVGTSLNSTSNNNLSEIRFLKDKLSKKGLKGKIPNFPNELKNQSTIKKKDNRKKLSNLEFEKPKQNSNSKNKQENVLSNVKFKLNNYINFNLKKQK